MKLKDRLRRTIQREENRVLLRGDLYKLGGRAQLTAALRDLQDDGVLSRIGKGVYIPAAAAMRAERESNVLEALSRQVFVALGAKVSFVLASNVSITVFVTNQVAARRSFVLGGRLIRAHYLGGRSKPQIPSNVDELPRENVGDYIRRLARSFHVSYRRTALESWAEAVARAAGDDVSGNAVQGLLVELKRLNALNGAQFNRLLASHMRETANARL